MRGPEARRVQVQRDLDLATRRDGARHGQHADPTIHEDLVPPGLRPRVEVVQVDAAEAVDALGVAHADTRGDELAVDPVIVLVGLEIDVLHRDLVPGAGRVGDGGVAAGAGVHRERASVTRVEPHQLLAVGVAQDEEAVVGVDRA